jgi:hypothetical protein
VCQPTTVNSHLPSASIPDVEYPRAATVLTHAFSLLNFDFGLVGVIGTADYASSFPERLID